MVPYPLRIEPINRLVININMAIKVSMRLKTHTLGSPQLDEAPFVSEPITVYSVMHPIT